MAPAVGSARGACRWLGVHRRVRRYVPQNRGDAALRAQLRALAEQYPRWGVPLPTDVLRRQDERVYHKRVLRRFRLEDLKVGRHSRKRAGSRVPLPISIRANGHWAMDVMHDTLAEERTFRVPSIRDALTRECLAIVVDTSLPGVRVVAVLVALLAARAWPGRLTVDNGPEF